MKLLLVRYFAVYAVANALSLTLVFGFSCGLIIPPLVWLFTHQLSWMPFNEWLARTLLGIPIGIMMAGMMTLAEWTRRTDASLMKKVVVSVLISSLLAAGTIAAAKGIRFLLPIS